MTTVLSHRDRLAIELMLLMMTMMEMTLVVLWVMVMMSGMVTFDDNIQSENEQVLKYWDRRGV